MASIFTFDPDPPRVSSPWSTTPTRDLTDPASSGKEAKLPSSQLKVLGGRGGTGAGTRIPNTAYSHVTRLEAEPQEGPTEYKLHLLLRRRRSFVRSSTSNGRHISGSLRRPDMSGSKSRSLSESGLLSTTPPPAAILSRQHRLEQLTTQLLWRLQQSCSYHISSSSTPVIPQLPEESRLTTPDMPQRLLPGLEESKGALYEIGVADDGTIVGLAEDEMEESLNNLRAMAASLGCGVEVLRMVPVGDCEWVEVISPSVQNVQMSKLLVAEALVRPNQHLINHSKQTQQHDKSATMAVRKGSGFIDDEARELQATEQLRVSVTGATMSGKSSLVGTLSTATLDNGRGKSRLSLLKHRHEIASGMTSSVTQELIGYCSTETEDASMQVISYGSRDVTSWIDIHAAVESADRGRLVFLSDSAGHPRFRRTTVRGIVGWQPHWTILCVPADNSDESTGKLGASPSSRELLGPAAADLDLSQAHLQLCLALSLPLVIVITKYDLATKAGLRQTLSNLLSALKEAGRKPCIISDTSAFVDEVDLHTVSRADLQEAEKTMTLLTESPLAAVPILLTSAVKGTGIHKLHAFLQQLPLPTEESLQRSVLSFPLFYIEDVYSVRASSPSDRSAIVGGHLRHCALSIGDEFLLGPYPIDTSSDDSDSGSGRSPARSKPISISRSFPGALHTKTSRNSSLRDRSSEWRRVRITSLRNLRLPVRTLHPGQVGTLGITPVDTPILSPSINRIRKGMVLAAQEPKAKKIITVRFEGAQAQYAKELSVGSAVVVYVASVRASSKVVSVAAEHSPAAAATQTKHQGDADNDDDDVGFGLGFADESPDGPVRTEQLATIVTFQFIASREFVEIGAKALVMPGGGPGLSGGNERGAKGFAGLEGFVGIVMDEDET
ncbi:hypothetical protein ACN47E_001465 [Coniothyrium glycines]